LIATGVGYRLDDHVALRALRAFVPFVSEVERIAQESASIETVLYENELRREIECWGAIKEMIERRIADRRALAQEQIERRAQEPLSDAA
jgi:hypothetical protein